MIEHFTPAVVRALELARRVAAALEATEVAPLHVLRALLQEEEGRPFLMLRDAGARADELRQWAKLPAGLPAEDQLELPLNPASQSALRQAREMARDIALDPTASSEQLMMTLLWEKAELRRAMEAAGADLTALQERLFAAIEAPAIALDEPLELDDVAAQMDVARILDANANRAREALRVVEDYCRFALNDAFLSRELKTLRHDLSAALNALPARTLLGARETQHDVGTEITTEQEQKRYSPRDVVRANLKRLEEALRSLEEFAKLSYPLLGQALEKMRYRAYTLERVILFDAEARARLADVRLYLLLTGSACWGPLEWTVREAVAGGVQMIQLREKGLTDRELWQRAVQVRRWTRETGTLFIMNDRPDLARLVEADGVHLGQDELPVKEARRILGPEALIGVSTHNLDQLHQAVCDGASYVGVGPTFPSETKAFDELAGLTFVRQVAVETSLPAFVIGGVTLANLPRVLEASGRRVAVSAALCRSETPQALAKAMRDLLDSAEE
jgi:thiamine-phosphate pyrophosphorylase